MRHRIGTIKENNLFYAVYLDIEIKHKAEKDTFGNPVQWRTTNLKIVTDRTELSISGYISRTSQDFLSAGQCQDTIRESINNGTFIFNNWPKNKILKVLDIWDNWHLNDLNSGTDKQKEVLKDMPGEYEYTKACDFLKSKGIYQDRGYKYGHAWLYKALPKHIVNYINKINEVIL